MVRVTVDTERDSKATIRHAIELLRRVLDESPYPDRPPMRYEEDRFPRYDPPRHESPVPDTTPDLFSMFSDSSTSSSTSVQEEIDSTPSIQDLLGSEPSEKKDDGDDEDRSIRTY